jgi:hypothetical protein
MDTKSQMSIERALEVWRGPAMSDHLRESRVLHDNDEGMIALADSFTADELEAMAVLIRAGEI